MADRNPSTGVADGCWSQLLKSSDSCTQVARYLFQVTLISIFYYKILKKNIVMFSFISSCFA